MMVGGSFSLVAISLTSIILRIVLCKRSSYLRAIIKRIVKSKRFRGSKTCRLYAVALARGILKHYDNGIIDVKLLGVYE
jgi:hypothetical protein